MQANFQVSDVTGDSLAESSLTLYNVDGYTKANQREWGFHSAKVNCVDWSPDRYL